VDFLFGETPLTVIVNHWRSQIGGNEAERLAGAGFLASEIRRMGAPNLVVLGDLNDSEGSAPVRALAEQAGLTNLSWYVPRERRYSLLFEGVSDAFDHILVNLALFGKITALGFAHYNADFPFTPNQGAGTAIRAADHDNPFVHFQP
jgi:predicted extracellular nuclease